MHRTYRARPIYIYMYNKPIYIRIKTRAVSPGLPAAGRRCCFPCTESCRASVGASPPLESPLSGSMVGAHALGFWVLIDSVLVGSLGGVPREQKMLKRHLPRVKGHLPIESCRASEGASPPLGSPLSVSMGAVHALGFWVYTHEAPL